MNNTPIEELNLSVRTFNCLKRRGIHTLGELMALSDEELRQVRNLGSRGIEEIRKALEQYKEQKEDEEWEERLSELETEFDIELDAELCEEQPAPDPELLLSELIGLDAVKNQVRKLNAYARMRRDLEENGKCKAPVVMNMAFEGNPGTAKTTVARILAGFFYKAGLLKQREILEVGRADLVARYEGQTATKVREVFERARGRLLFIDEAYSLVEGFDGSFGDEAINTIVQEMENNREETIVVFAGYPDKMQELFGQNPGLRSRVPFMVRFPDYTASEMCEIVRMEAQKRGFEIAEDAHSHIYDICEAATDIPDAGNGRFCRNLVEAAILNFAYRIYGDEWIPADKAFRLISTDFELPKELQPPTQKHSFGFCA